ncbi:MAG: substrate-binding domain-containing protein [Rhodoferax sp.]|uniref:substrate-binding domain-containing protein n=1 Tax=Rhodoferax sp. TaxID=50421 RepID=UPI0030164958
MILSRFASLIFVLCLTANVAAQPAAPKVIAFAQDTLKNDFRLAQVNEVRDAVAAHPELSFVYSDAQGQTSLLIRQIEQFIAQKVDVLVLGTNDEQAVVPVVSKAYKAGIPVIVLDRGIKGQDYSTFINSDNVQIGAIGAQFIAEKLKGKGLVLLFEGLQSADVTHLRSQGFLAVMAKYPGLKVIKRTGNYLRKDALLEMEKLLAQGVRVDAIFSESDSMLSGARMALQNQKVDLRKLVSVGCDYTSEARDAIRNGTQTGSVLFPLGGNMAVEVAQKLLAKTAVSRHVVIPVKLVTRDNVEQVSPIF